MEVTYASGRTKCNQSKSKQDNAHHKTINSAKSMSHTITKITNSANLCSIKE